MYAGFSRFGPALAGVVGRAATGVLAGRWRAWRREIETELVRADCVGCLGVAGQVPGGRRTGGWRLGC
jgi:hypothetical protein